MENSAETQMDTEVFQRGAFDNFNFQAYLKKQHRVKNYSLERLEVEA